MHGLLQNEGIDTPLSCKENITTEAASIWVGKNPGENCIIVITDPTAILSDRIICIRPANRGGYHPASTEILRETVGLSAGWHQATRIILNAAPAIQRGRILKSIYMLGEREAETITSCGETIGENAMVWHFKKG